MKLSHSCGPASSAGSGYSIDSHQSNEYTRCLNQDPVPSPPTVPARARVRQFHTDNLDFTWSDAGPDIVALSSGVTLGAEYSNPPHITAQISTPAPVVPSTAGTDSEKAIKNKQKVKLKLANGKHSAPLPINNVYVSKHAGGRGRAKVGGAGAPAGTCVLM